MHGLGDHLDAVNRTAAQVTRSVADGRGLHVAGDFGPTDELPAPLGLRRGLMAGPRSGMPTQITDGAPIHTAQLDTCPVLMGTRKVVRPFLTRANVVPFASTAPAVSDPRLSPRVERVHPSVQFWTADNGVGLAHAPVRAITAATLSSCA